jgi:DDE superfamily endonuclease
MSAISTRGRMHFMVFTASFDARIMCRFLDLLVGHFERTVHLVVDRHSAHRSKSVRTWLADHKDQIELHFLPSHSPETNPHEPVNADLKRSLPHTHRARSGRTRSRNPPVPPPPTTPAPHRARILRRPTRPPHPQRMNTMNF